MSFRQEHASPCNADGCARMPPDSERLIAKRRAPHRMAARTSNEKMADTSSQPDFFETSRRGVADTELRRKLESSTGRHLEHVNEVRSEFPSFDDERDTARRIKHDAISRLDELLVQLKQRLEANGCKGSPGLAAVLRLPDTAVVGGDVD